MTVSHFSHQLHILQYSIHVFFTSSLKSPEQHCASSPQKLLVSRDACQQLWSPGISNGQETVADTIWTQLD